MPSIKITTKLSKIMSLPEGGRSVTPKGKLLRAVQTEKVHHWVTVSTWLGRKIQSKPLSTMFFDEPRNIQNEETVNNPQILEFATNFREVYSEIRLEETTTAVKLQ